jgi:hypothetical protein
VLGLKKLGHDVLFLEWSEDYDACYDPSKNTMTNNPDYGLRFIHSTFKAFSLDNNWAYFDEHTSRCFGQSKQKVSSFIENCDVLINLSGITALRPEVQKIRQRVFLDTDPLFTQIRHLQDSAASEIAKAHTHHFTFAENIGKAKCSMPNDGFNWIATRQPIVMDVWKFNPVNPNAKLTTVMQWDSYKTRAYNGVEYGMKSKSFSLIEDIPSQVTQQFEIAVGSATAPKQALQAKGWQIVDPLEITKTPWTYQDFISSSKGEFTIAKHGYVASWSGWFSERSAAYLASGRPVITQETGFSEIFETGKGLFSFSTTEEAMSAIDELNSNIAFHCQKARNLAEEFFDADKVLTDFLQKTV